ncbi:MAG: hypothetical protein DDT21_02307 [Syntrophomonadaceae bacterium]|nr:hypothetical protein [Bacillota bacterium]
MNIDVLAHVAEIDVLAVLSVLGIFGWGAKADQPLDADDVYQRLNEGLAEVSDADRRGGNMRHYPALDAMSLEDAQLARRMADALEKAR